MLTMLRKADLPHTKSARIAAVRVPQRLSRRSLKDKNVYMQFLDLASAEAWHPLVVSTIASKEALQNIDTGRNHHVQIARCDPDTPFVAFSRAEFEGESAADAIRRVCGSP